MGMIEKEIERGLTDRNVMVRWQLDLHDLLEGRTKKINPAEIEFELTHRSVHVRGGAARRTDFTPTPAQIERGLMDEHWDVRESFALRTDYTSTPAQIERGLKDDSGVVREVFKARQAEWRAKWEATELRKRHASITATKPTLEAL
jgi:hypothetical protein